MKTKLLAFLLALVMVVLALASCGPTDPADDTCPPHVDDDSDGICDKCLEKVPGNKPVTPGGSGNNEDYVLPEITWSNSKPVELLFSMTDNSNREELSSGCRRYLSGERLTTDGSSSIFDSVDERNGDAEDYANVHLTYTYYADTTDWVWGKCLSNELGGIFQKATQPDELGRPDMFVNFVYDMVSASLLGSFNNLYTNKVASSGVNSADLQNYFAFAKDGAYNIDYKDTYEDGHVVGYMVDYMQSLTLSEKKMYLVASDYFIDLVRAFFAVPVNVNMIETMTASEDPDSYFYDYVDDDIYTIADFYALVNDGRWTYDAVKAFSEKMYSAPTDSGEVLSGKWGFALASGGLGSSGILYTTSITIIQREVEEVVIGYDEQDNAIMGQEYHFYYPDNFNKLNEFVGELGSLFGSTGVTYVENRKQMSGVNSVYNDTPENAVRDYFVAGNNIGFGGIICVGSLEGEKYASMADKGGFGIVPVPLYQETRYDEELGTEVPERYLTQIHNVGRVGAIGIMTTKFAQCTAFLNYQSLNSTDILNNYYKWTLCGDVAGGVPGTDEMLRYIRDNVRSSFDKAFEDAVARQASISNPSDPLSENKWHNIIATHNYSVEVSAMNQYYESFIGLKIEALAKLETSYEGLTPDPT